MDSLPQNVLADTHCHLNFYTFDDDREQVVERARQAGVQRILNPGIDLGTSRSALELSEIYPEIYVAVGIHPNDALAFDQETIGQLRGYISSPKVVAIGEIGLDYYHEDAPYDVQQQVLQSQLELAAEANLPVIIHNRQSSDDLLRILTGWHEDLVHRGSALAERPGVLHSFSGDEETALKAAAMKFYIGITGPVTFRNAAVLQQVVAAVPLSSLLIETDSPFLTPAPHRGQRNEPAYVSLVAEKIASIKKEPLPVVAETTSANARRLFLW